MKFADRLQYIETSAIRELFKLLGQPGIISFAGGFPDAALLDATGIAEASLAALAYASVMQYGATEGYLPLRERLCEFMQPCKLNVDDVIVTTGSQQAIDLIGKTMITPGDRVLVESPTFLAAIQCFRLYGAQVIGVPTDAQGVDVDRLAAMIDAHQPKLVYLIPTFSNPGGATLSLERRQRVLQLAAQTQTLVVEDDPYSKLYFHAPPPASLLALSASVEGSCAWLAHCGSLSKILSPGLRVGWLVAPPALLAKATMCKQFSDANTSTLVQAIGAHYFTLDRLEGALTRMRQTYASRAAAMAHCLREAFGDDVDFHAPQGGLFLWARLSPKLAPTGAQAFARQALSQGVAFVPGTPFYANDPDMQTLRLSFATANEDTIAQGIERLRLSSLTK